jgi:hypothetical protein
VTVLHTYLQRELPLQDWTRLTRSRLLSSSHSLQFPKGPLDLCILEILFANSELTDLAASQYCTIAASDHYSLLSDRARHHFADANILHFRANPPSFFDRLVSSSDAFLASVFRRRDDLSLLSDTFIPPDGHAIEFVTAMESIFPRLPPDCLFTFFLCAVFPSISFFSSHFLHQLFVMPAFPSADPAFPVGDFLASQPCVDNISLKVFFDCFVRTEDDDLMIKLFDKLLQVEDDPVTVLSALFRSTKDSIERFKSLFLHFLNFSKALSAELMYNSANEHLSAQAEALSALYAVAIVEDVRRDLFLMPLLLQIFWDYAFIIPVPTLEFLLAVTETCGDASAVVEFWNAPTTIPCLVDSVMGFHSQSTHLITFLLELGKRGPEWLTRQLLTEVEPLPCVHVFTQICADRFRLVQ